MKTLILALVLATGAFAQGRFGRVPVHHSHFPVRVIAPRPTVVVSPSPWGARWGVYAPWGFPGYYPPTVVYSPPPAPPDPCRKEKLKDANGRKHEILVCRQPDGSVSVIDPSNPPPPPPPPPLSPSPEN